MLESIPTHSIQSGSVTARGGNVGIGLVENSFVCRDQQCPIHSIQRDSVTRAIYMYMKAEIEL